MFVLSKGAPKSVSRIADVKNANAGRVVPGRDDANGKRKLEKDHAVLVYGTRTNIWAYPVGFANQSDRTNHPAPFPEALASDHIRSWSNPGDTVLDPMCGSGTTGKMARKNGCKFIGIDVSDAYLRDFADVRLAQEVLAFASSE